MRSEQQDRMHSQSGSTPEFTSATSMRVQLPAQLDVASVTRLYQMLAPLVDAAGSVILDASAVERVHAAALQVLAAFIRVRASVRGATQLRDVTRVLREAAERAGLSAALALTPASN